MFSDSDESLVIASQRHDNNRGKMHHFAMNRRHVYLSFQEQDVAYESES